MPPPSQETPSLAEQEEAMRQDVSFTDRLLSTLRRDCKVTDIRRAGLERQHAWFVRVRPNRSLTEQFGLANELLVLVVGREVESRDVEAARSYLDDPEMRVEQDLMLVVDGGTQLARRLLRLPRQREHRIPWELDRRLLEVLQRWLPRYDLFDMRDPVRGRDVIGRRTEIERVRQLVDAGGCGGVLGLRKVGKTTLVRAVTDAIEHRTPVPGNPLRQEYAAWVDVQGLVHKNVDQLARKLLADLLRVLPPMEAEALPDDGIEALDTVLRWLLQLEERRVILVVDEFDFLVEGRSPDLDGLVRFFGVCRAWSQGTGGRLALVLIGRDPENITGPRLAGLPNPALAWIRELWLGPMPRNEADELLASLGKKVGLSIGARTLASCRAWTGGHPMLVRRFGSTALRVSTETQRWSTDDDLARIEAEFPFDSGALAIAAEVEALLRERYPTAFESLRASVSGTEPPGDRVLQRFGIVVDGSVPRIWREWFRSVRPLAVAS